MSCDCVSLEVIDYGPLPSPAPTQLVVPTETVFCSGETCACSGTKACVFQCGAGDSCDGTLLLCPRNFDCTLFCDAAASCDGVKVIGPVGHALSVHCVGDASCHSGDFLAAYSTEVSYSCGGVASCNGATTTLNCGTGHCAIECPGAASCDAAVIAIGQSASFSCSGPAALCPPTPAPTTATPTTPSPTLPTPPPTTPMVTGPAAPIPPLLASSCSHLPRCPCPFALCLEERDPTAHCHCECPLEVLVAEYQRRTDICGASGSPLSYIPSSCACDCPPGTPTAAECLTIGRVLRDCECQRQSTTVIGTAVNNGPSVPMVPTVGVAVEAPPARSPFCCDTLIPGFTPYVGRCWRHRTEAECAEEADNAVTVCRWNEAECLGDPPVNALNPYKGCAFRDEACGWDGDCCSEVCRVGGLCR